MGPMYTDWAEIIGQSHGSHVSVFILEEIDTFFSCYVKYKLEKEKKFSAHKNKNWIEKTVNFSVYFNPFGTAHLSANYSYICLECTFDLEIKRFVYLDTIYINVF